MTAVLYDPAAETRALVDAAKEGDREAFGALYARYRPTVYKYVRPRLRDTQTAEDLTQEVFRRALTRISTFEHQGRDLGAWLVTIARNLVADHYKSYYVRMQARTTTDWFDYDLIDEDRCTHPDLSAEQSAIAAAVVDAVAELSAEQRECMQLRFLRGLSVAETAAVMGRNEGAVKALAYRAMANLRRAPALEALR